MRSALLAFLVCLPLLNAPDVLGAADNLGRGGAATLEERQMAEKASRSRYRNLEVASLVLIIAAGGAAIFWAVRRK